MSGFEVTYEVIDETRFVGWPPMRHMFGTPKLVKNFMHLRMSDICVAVDGTPYPEITGAFSIQHLNTLDDFCVAGLEWGCGDYELEPDEITEFTTKGSLNIYDFFYQTNPITSEKAIGYGVPEGRLIGFKAIVGENLGGTFENIR